MTKKGLYKLATRPHLFLMDYIKKKRYKIEYLIPQKKVTGSYQYTVVSAVYKVEDYLEDYFNTLVHQTLDFEKHIFLVLVDDGSPDHSALIIKKWQEKYPNNIQYIKKANGGQASARNVGLAQVHTEWVTFIDPDDFVDRHYFEYLDKFLSTHEDKDFAMLSCNLLFFYEKGAKVVDTHPLKYKFKGKNIVSIDNMEGKIQLSASTALFKNAIIVQNHLRFNEQIRPSFEDAHFIGRYILHAPSNTSVAFVKEAKYMYRKRRAATSTLDTGWQMPSAFDEVLEIGCLGLFKESMALKGRVSKEMQKTVLYHLIWQFKKIVNNSSSINFLSDTQKEKYKALLRQIFTYIEFDTIDGFNLAGAWFYHKVALLGRYKDTSYTYQIAYIDAYDEIKNELKIRYFSFVDSTPFFTLDNKETLPRHLKVRRHEFLGEKFVQEYIAWVPLSQEQAIFNAFIDNQVTSISVAGKHWGKGVNTTLIQNHFKPKRLNSAKFPLRVKLKRRVYQNSYFSQKFKDAWLLMDREAQADDSAEHLYRYLRDHQPDKNIFYIIKLSSNDGLRLKAEGFNLIDFGSVEHEASLIYAQHLISSDAVKYITNYLPNQYYKDLLSYKFTFLQHGVTKDDLSAWLNTKAIACFVTAANPEYDSIAGDNNKYKFTSKEVVLTGFPRHDNLLNNNRTDNKSIMIMPTWREYLNEIDTENRGAFAQSSYGKAWITLLHSDFIKELSQKEGYQLRFFPHPNIKKFLDEFAMPNYIEVLIEPKESIQVLFQRSDLLLTDYSSVAFEMAILEKPTLYYQFDHEEIFSGAHTYEKGYFEYEKDAFGPICYTQKQVIEALSSWVNNQGEINPMYQARMRDFFAYHDTNNSQRVFTAIENLYLTDAKEISDTMLLQYAVQAWDKKIWKAIEYRYELLKQRGIGLDEEDLILAQAKQALGKVEEARKLLNTHIAQFGQTQQSDKVYQDIKKTEALLNLLDEKKRFLLINQEEDLFSTLRYGTILKWFKEKEWEILTVATKLIDKRFIVKKELAYFYYICLVTANELDKKEEALFYLSQVRDY